jgi:hypothetical protein
MQWLVLCYALTVGYVPFDNTAIVSYSGKEIAAVVNTNAVLTKLDISLEAIDHIRLYGSIDVRETWANNGKIDFDPYESRYYFALSVFGPNWEAGFSNECYHGNERGGFPRNWFGGGSTMFFVKLSGRSPL